MSHPESNQSLLTPIRGVSQRPTEQPDAGRGAHTEPSLQPGSLAALRHFLATPEANATRPQPGYNPGLSGPEVSDPLHAPGLVDLRVVPFRTGTGACSGMKCIPCPKKLQ